MESLIIAVFSAAFLIAVLLGMRAGLAGLKG